MSDKQTISKQLAKCPFCGGEAYLREFTGLNGTTNYYVECGYIECGVSPDTSIFSTEEEAIKAWNTRVPMERIVERLEEESVLSEGERDRAREQNPLQYERCDSYICAIDNAIEIVKEEGGIE